MLEGDNMIVERENGVILYNIHFKKIDVYLNCATGFLLSSDMKFLSIDKDAIKSQLSETKSQLEVYKSKLKSIKQSSDSDKQEID